MSIAKRGFLFAGVMLIIELQDSFVHTLANYMRQTGANVVTLRAGFTEAQLDAVSQ